MEGAGSNWVDGNAFLLPDGQPDYLRLILTARVYDILQETPLTHAINLSEKYGSRLLLKREDLTPVFSFKVRGAYNKLAHLPPESRWKGVIACSAGNHAQGVAYSARHLGIPATIVMPLGTPSIKVNNVARMGSKVVLYGEDFDEAKKHCAMLCARHGLTDIPPYDDPYIIAGQGTTAMEILRQTDVTNLEAVFCCVGGGGLMAGIASYIKRIAPHVKIIGVETMDADAMTRSIQQKERVLLKEVGLFADGAAVKIVGEETFRLVSMFADEMILVSTDEICAAIKDVFEDTRTIAEPAGALAVAGMKKYLARNPGSSPEKSYVAVISGANMNFDRLRFVAERSELGEGREVFMTLIIPERKGSFVTLIDKILNPRIITEFSYRFNDPNRAAIYISFKVQNPVLEVPEIIAECAKYDMVAEDISQNEMAKSHGRYLIGGKADCANERLYRFEFPEKPGALHKFLVQMNPDWNISLFHYRNHGEDTGKILAGFQVSESDQSQFDQYLKNLKYAWEEETDNPVYIKFMKGN